MQKKLLIIIVTKLFGIAVNDLDVERSARYSWVLVVSGTQCNLSQYRCI